MPAPPNKPSPPPSPALTAATEFFNIQEDLSPAERFALAASFMQRVVGAHVAEPYVGNIHPATVELAKKGPQSSSLLGAMAVAIAALDGEDPTRIFDELSGINTTSLPSQLDSPRKVEESLAELQDLELELWERVLIEPLIAQNTSPNRRNFPYMAVSDALASDSSIIIPTDMRSLVPGQAQRSRRIFWGAITGYQLVTQEPTEESEEPQVYNRYSLTVPLPNAVGMTLHINDEALAEQMRAGATAQRISLLKS